MQPMTPTPPTGLQGAITNKMFGKKKAAKKKKPAQAPAKATMAQGAMPPKGIAVGNPMLAK